MQKNRGKVYTKFNLSSHLFTLKTKQKNNLLQLTRKLILWLKLN